MGLGSICTLLVVVAAFIIIACERWKPYTPGQAFLRDGFFNDFVWYTLVQSYVLGLCIAWLVGSIDYTLGLNKWQAFRELPLWIQFVVFLITHDFYIYWFHRWQHKNKYLWLIHEAHHSTHELDWLSGSRSHAVEILINQSIELLPIILLGASSEVIIIKACVDAIWGMYIHSNIDVRSSLLQRIVNGPEMHRWHHVSGKEAHRYNFGTKLAVWDWLFGTAYLPKDLKPTKYGLKSIKFPSAYLSQLLYAFRRSAR